MAPARSLHEIITGLTGDAGASGDLASVLHAGGYPDLPPDLLAEAVVSFAGTAPAEIAEHYTKAFLADAAAFLWAALVVQWGRRVASRFPDGQLFVDLRGHADRDGRPLAVTQVAAADELAAAASLLMGQADEGVPAVIVRGFPYPLREGAADELVRPRAEDLFR